MDTYWYCGVLVKGIQTVYSYISDTGELPLDSYVMVPFGRRNVQRTGIVKSCAEYAAEDAPYPVNNTKHILRKATAEEYENQPPLPSFHVSDDIEDDLEEVNYYIGVEDWEEVFEWATRNHDYPDERTTRKVIECYELCLKHDMPEAALNLGTFYYTGRLVEQNYPKAYELYKIAADAGVLRAICNCGYCFY
nr:SEL1-like repeat protein [bacterium]